MLKFVNGLIQFIDYMLNNNLILFFVKCVLKLNYVVLAIISDIKNVIFVS